MQPCENETDRPAQPVGAGGAGIGGGRSGPERRARRGGTWPKTSLTPDQALAALKEGNARYVSNPQVCVMDLAKRRADVAGHQAPWATIVGCADSRVPPELLFGGLGLGELFVARNAGNLVDTATMGTVEYGAEHLGSPLLVVLGHEKLRRGRRGLRGRHQERQVAGLDRPHGQADRPGGHGHEGQARRFRRQHRARERQAHGRSGLPSPARSCRSSSRRRSSRSSPRATISTTARSSICEA